MHAGHDKVARIEMMFSSTKIVNNSINNSSLNSITLILCCYMHAGTGITLRHMRWNNTCGAYQELPPIDQNLQYDFNLQQFTILPHSVTVLPVSSGLHQICLIS